MTTDYQDEKITLAALLGGIWPRNPFMAEIALQTPTTLRELMDRADGFINVEDTLEALTAPPTIWNEQANLRAAGQSDSRGRHRRRKGLHS